MMINVSEKIETRKGIERASGDRSGSSRTIFNKDIKGEQWESEPCRYLREVHLSRGTATTS